MGISWGALAGAFLAPFLYGLYSKKTTKTSVFVCIIFGVGIMILNMLFKTAFPLVLQSPINCGAFAMLAGLVLIPIVNIITKKPDSKMVDDMFECYNVKVVTSAKKTLGDN